MDVRSFVALRLLTSPLTMLPVLAGAGLLGVSFVMHWGAAGIVAGAAGIVLGLGAAGARLVGNLESLVQEARKASARQLRRRRARELRALQRKLVRDDDPRAENALRELELAYRGLHAQIDSGRLALHAEELVERIESLLDAAMHSLEHSYELWQAARRMSGEARERTLHKREALTQEVLDAVARLGRRIESLRAAPGQPAEDLDRFRDELDEAIEVARRTEERIDALGRKPYSEQEFE